MGLFDFVKGIGNKIFGKEEEAPAALKAHIEKDNPGVENLNIQVKDGVAHISGDAASKSAWEKTILMAGNALGISEVKADDLTVAGSSAAQPAAEEVEYYIIVSGDNLSKIAKHFYGDANLIFPGQKIRIPKQA